MNRIFLALILSIAWIDANAQSSLPPCPADTSVVWTNCFGTLNFGDAEKYVGEFKDGKYHGQGAYTYKSGATYVGEYENGKRQGQGKYTYPSGGIYVGGFKDGKRHGQGTYTGSDGWMYVGGWRGSKYYGQGSLISAKGYTIADGMWLDDDTVYAMGGSWHWASFSDTTAFFVLSDSIRRDGAFRRAWLMFSDFEPDSGDKVLSTKILTKFDCASERTQIMSFASFSGAFGSGGSISSFSGDDKWQYVQPGSAYSTVAKYVCDYKLTPSK